MRRYALTALAALACAVATTGCEAEDGVESASAEDRQEVTPAPKPRQRRTPRHKERRPAPRPALPALTSCDANIRVKTATTTCPFAQNAFWTYWTDGQTTASVDVWSPAAQAVFATTCARTGSQVRCTTDDGGLATFPQAALEMYSQEQADAYADSHDLGPTVDADVAAPTDPPPPAEDCQGYDPCLEPGPDVDCEGGEGNGPRYVAGPVYVNGSDPYDLDYEGDGVGCE